LETFRLEEVLRILLIAVVASALGVMFDFASDLILATDQKAVVSVGALLVFMLFAWPAASCTAFIIGLLLHIGLRLIRLPRSAYLILFVIVGSAATWLVFPHGFRGYQFISFGTAFFSWLLYCFGPFPLWGYRFDPFSDSDF